MIRTGTLATLTTATLAMAVTAALTAMPAGAHIVRPASSFKPAGVEAPFGVAVAQATGDVYVTGLGSSNIEKFSATGVAETSFVSPSVLEPLAVAVDNTCYEQKLSGGACTAADPSNGDVYVSEFATGTLVELDSSGAEVAAISASSIPSGDPGSGGFQPWGVAVDPANGDVVVVDRDSEEVDIFSSAGVFVSQFHAPEAIGVAVGAGSAIFTNGERGAQDWSPSDGYSTPTKIDPAEDRGAIGVDLSTGNVLVDELEKISEYEASGGLLSQFGGGILEGSFGMGIDEATGAVYATQIEKGVVEVFGAPEALAGATTGTPATAVTSTTADVGGSIDPESASLPVTGCTFEYGLTVSYGLQSACSPAPPFAGNAAVAVAGSLSGLHPDETYHYRVAAVNANGPSYGEDETFQTPPSAPTLDGESVSAVTQTSAILNARINPNDEDTTYHFQFGASAAYGTVLPAPDADIGSEYGDVNVGQQLTGLSPGTTYHYRVVATNATSPPGGTIGPDETFTTPPPQPPVVSTGQASGVAQNTAALTATIDTEGYETTYEFDLGTDTGYGTRIFGDAGSEPGTQTFAVPLQGLAPGTTYHYRIVASNTFGTTYGADVTFTTGSYPSAVLAAPAVAPLIPALLLAPASSGGTSTAKASSVRPAAHAARNGEAGKRARRHRRGGRGKAARQKPTQGDESR
ncbi:MAG TPA: hypothetical protein VNV42_08815 [Solirubrobacteraceae bacterium]|jgi:DNA-binding beta-propeller fold protein YncE|nr:hypothetical protein [Solirubrobacteraceae bacterium]